METKAAPKRRKLSPKKASPTNQKRPTAGQPTRKHKRPKAVQPKRGTPTSVILNTPVNSPLPPIGEANVINSEVSTTYQISRSGQTYGPYTLADLQRYVASGNVLLSDLAKSGEMAQSVPVSTVLELSPAISGDPSSAIKLVYVVFVGVERQACGTSSGRKYRRRAAYHIEHVAAMKSLLESRADQVWNAFCR